MIAFVAWLLMLSVAASGGEIYAAPQESETPEAALRTLIRANAEKDLSVLESHMAKDEDVVGYTIGGRKYLGWQQLARAMQEEFDTVNRLEISITELKVWRHGDIAWFSMELNYVRYLGINSKPMVLPLRETGVLQRRDGKWLLVSWHESFQGSAMNGLENSMDLTGGQGPKRPRR